MGGPTPAFSERVHVTLSPKGDIFLNPRAHAMIGKAMAVYLYYNRPKDMIIIEPTAALTANNAFVLKHHMGKTHSARLIRANPFCKHFNILPATTIRFISPEPDAVGRLYLKLHETVSVATPNRGPRKKQPQP